MTAEVIHSALGQLPAHNLDAERAVLGAILLEGRDALPRVAAVLQTSDFYLETHRVIYETMLRLLERGEPVDLLILSEELRRTDQLQFIGGPAALALLVEQASIAAYLMSYVAIVRDLAAQREQMQVLMRALARNHDGAPIATAREVIGQLERIAERVEPRDDDGRPRGPRPLGAVLAEYEAQLDSPETDFVSFALPELDERLGGGALRGEVVLLGGPHSAGKTAYALQIAAQNARRGHRVLVISREMLSVALARRLLAQHGRIDAKALRRRELDVIDRAKVRRALPHLRELPVWLDDTTASLPAIRRLVRDGDYRLILIDYLQLLEPPATARGNRRLEVTEISRGLKRLAGQERVTVLALSSLSRLSVDRGKRAAPQTSNLKESGDLEFDADVVLLIDWPDKTASERTITVGKAREGETGGAPITVDYMPMWVRFTIPDTRVADLPREREPGEDYPDEPPF